jgi:REP element-mobilizing transposase RayT
VNHNRVGRILREDNLLCIRRRKFVRTTDSNHSFRIYPNLAGEMKLTGVDQLWIADIIHVLLLPKVSPSRLLQSLKGATARQANLLLGRTGETFWQAESYDHWVRDESEWDRIAA